MHLIKISTCSNCIQLESNKIEPFGVENPGKDVPNDGSEVVVVTVVVPVVTAGNTEPKVNSGALLLSTTK